MEKCATRTNARVAWKVVLCCSNRASICSHAIILLSQTRWIIMTGWHTSISLQPFAQTRLECGSVLYTSISLHLVFQTCPDCGSLLRTRISIQLCVQNMFGLWFVSVCKHLSTALRLNIFGLWFLVVSSIVSNTCGLWIFVCVHASSPSLCFKRLDYGSVSVYKHLSPAPFDQTRLDWCSLLCTSISPHPCFKHILWFLVRVHHQSTALCLKHV